mmetsp:Transcript_4873/g.6694  ORF Transcript_4873/g.6694 Transcript_4873/m.6694 type:complete len:158 (-) Transcript_4873:428-901(-)
MAMLLHERQVAEAKGDLSLICSPRRKLKDAISQDKAAGAVLDGRGSSQLPEVPEFDENEIKALAAERKEMFDTSSSAKSDDSKFSLTPSSSQGGLLSARRHSRRLSGSSMQDMTISDYRDLVRNVSETVVGDILQTSIDALTPRSQGKFDYEKYRKK